jgi:hypothetical protein
MKVSTTFDRDVIDSVTLKSFRKVIGYDTFESILNKDRNEQKDTDDHYNITVSMMVRRIPEPKAEPVADKYNGGESLAARLDKGFPYDDDGDISESTVAWKKKAVTSTKVGILNGENVTKENLVNLVKDSTEPVTQELVQLRKSDGTIMSSLLGENVTLGALKNLVTDKPAPITTKLAQKADGTIMSSLLGENVTLGALKNLVTDKPAPITVKLAQKSDGDNLSSLLGENITRGALKNLVTDKPAPITLKLAQIEKSEFPNATIEGDQVTGMNGDEEIHGAARVGGTGLTYNQKKKSHGQKNDADDKDEDEEVVRGRRESLNGDLHKKQ